MAIRGFPSLRLPVGPVPGCSGCISGGEGAIPLGHDAATQPPALSPGLEMIEPGNVRPRHGVMDVLCKSIQPYCRHGQLRV